MRTRRTGWKLRTGHSKGITNMMSILLSGGTGRTDVHYLIYNNGKQVKIDELLGKYVLLYFQSLPNDPGQTHHRADPNFMGDLKETYDIYNPRGEFEVVFVALGDNMDVFRDSFSLMPWLAIPHEDREAREYLETEYSIPYVHYETALFLAPDSTLWYENGMKTDRLCSALLDPNSFYSPIKGYRKSGECAALQSEIFLKNQKPSLRTLTALLGKYIISSDGEKVPTYKLDGKTLGLYFFEPTSRGFQQTSQLLEVWKSLKDERRQVFKKGRLTATDLAGDLIVLEPDNYEPLSYFAFNILERFGVDAYPFTMQRAVEIAKSEQQNQLVLGNLLSPEAPLCRGGSARYKERLQFPSSQGGVSFYCLQQILATNLDHFCLN